MWTDENRARYNRNLLKYPSDMTGDYWAHVEPRDLPAACGGGPRGVTIRAAANGEMYFWSTGCQ